MNQFLRRLDQDDFYRFALMESNFRMRVSNELARQRDTATRVRD